MQSINSFAAGGLSRFQTPFCQVFIDLLEYWVLVSLKHLWLRSSLLLLCCFFNYILVSLKLSIWRSNCRLKALFLYLNHFAVFSFDNGCCAAFYHLQLFFEGGLVSDSDIFVYSFLQPLDFFPLYFGLFQLNDFPELFVDDFFCINKYVLKLSMTKSCSLHFSLLSMIF